MHQIGRHRLTSWKEIASHLGRDVRTVLRWEKDRGLPVHRVPGATGRVVFAYTDELDTWSRGELEPAPSGAGTPGVEAASTDDGPGTSSPGRWRRAGALAVACAAIAIIAAAGWTWRRSDAPADIAQLTLTDSVARAMDAEGRQLWTFPYPQSTTPEPRRGLVEDLNGDGRPDALISVIVNDGSGTSGGILMALDHRGRLMWRQTVEDRFAFGAGQFSSPWQPDHLLVYRSGGRPYVAWSLHHYTWWPSLLAVFDGAGQRVGTFVNSGWIRTSAASHDGQYLLGGGISNSRNGAAFAILDARRSDGVSPEDPGSEFECRSCPRGSPERYYVIPWSDIVNPTLLDGRRGAFMPLPDGSIELRAIQQQNGEMIVELSPTFEVKRRGVSDGFWDWHRKFEREGLLAHGRDTCPFRDGPPLLEWTPELGWREVPR